MTLKLRLSLIVSGMVVFFALVAVLIYVTGTKSAGTGDGANVEKTAPSAGEAAKLKVKQTEADKYDAEVKKDMAVMYGAQKKYLELKGRYFQCGPFKGDDNCDGFDDNYPFDTMTPVLDNVPFSEMDKIYGIEQRDQWEYKGIDNTNDPRQFCYYAKLMNGGYYTASPKGNFERPERPWSFEECASSQIIASPEKTAIWRAETTKRDNERIADMGDAIRIQKECYANMGHYCQIDGYPGGTETVNIGKGWRQFLTDPLDEGQCGTGYLYCGLSNLDEPQDFCYYAKLEKGGFYVVSPAGGLKRDSAPESFRECREGILKGIKLLKPNGGEVWETGKTHRIEWQASAIDNVWLTVIYEPGNGGKAVENYIAPDFKGAPGATGYYDWTIDENWIPLGEPGRYKIRVGEYFDYETITNDKSDNHFTINVVPAPSGKTTEGRGKIYPVKSDDSCGSGLVKPDTDPWFEPNNCQAWKIYPVKPGKETLFHVRSGSGSCNRPQFSVSESNSSDANGSWQNKDGVTVDLTKYNMANLSYTPSMSYIKINASTCFYMDVYENVPEILSQITPLKYYEYIKKSIDHE